MNARERAELLASSYNKVREDIEREINGENKPVPDKGKTTKKIPPKRS